MTPRPPVRLVGIGASAGGLEALGGFLSAVAPGCGLAFAVVQHLDPTHKAMLAELLQRTTRMPVREASAPTRIEAGHVYVIPPNKALTLHGDTLKLAAPSQPRGLRRPIDELFESTPASKAPWPSAWCCRAWVRTVRRACRPSMRRVG